MRSYARETAFCLVYSRLINEDSLSEITEEFFDKKKLDEEDEAFALQLYNGALDNLEKNREVIANIAIGFKVERINKTEFALLTIAMYEIESGITPKAVAIDEAVKLARKYSGDKSTGFVNGILAKFIKTDTKAEVVDESI